MWWDELTSLQEMADQQWGSLHVFDARTVTRATQATETARAVDAQWLLPTRCYPSILVMSADGTDPSLQAFSIKIYLANGSGLRQGEQYERQGISNADFTWFGPGTNTAVWPPPTTDMGEAGNAFMGSGCRIEITRGAAQVAQLSFRSQVALGSLPGFGG